MEKDAMTELTFEATSRFLETPHGRLHYHEVGTGEPVVMLHGSGPGVSGWANFSAQLPLFSQHFRCLVLDLPGFGSSELGEGQHPMADAPTAVIRFCDDLGVTNARFVGNSLGANVTASVALLRPDLIGRFVAIGGIGVNIFSSMPAEGMRLLVDFVEEPTRENLIRWLHSMVYDPALVTEELIETRLARATEPKTLESMRKFYTRAGFAAIARHISGADATPSWAMLAKIDCPTLLVWGRDDRVSPIDMALLPMRLMPRCELHSFPNCGHWVMMERKDEFEDVVLSFLRRS
jgi:pimeloyl-ACP methyl ester carboxylesterase